MATILETLKNANYNLDNLQKVGIDFLLPVIKDQLNNAIVLLEKGYNLNEEVEPFFEKYDEIENVPNKKNEAYNG